MNVLQSARRMLSFALPTVIKDRIQQSLEIAHYQKKAAASKMLLTTSKRTLHLKKENKVITIARHNHPYLFDLIGNFDYYFGAVKPREENGVLIQDFSSRALHEQSEDALAFWFPSLPEPMATTKIYLEMGNLSAGETVFDLGAYAGAASYFFSQSVGECGHVYSFEPDRASYTCLLENIRMHRLGNVSAYCLGIWPKSGFVQFQSEGNMGSAIREAADRINSNLVMAEVTSLSDFCETHMIKKVDFVKIDIEGSEVAVLESSGVFIDTFKPRFAVEIHRLGDGLTGERVIAALSHHGYSVRLVPQAGLPLPLLFAEPVGS